MSPVHRRISSPRSWIRTSSSRTSIILVLKRNMSWRHILFSYLNLLAPNPAHQPIRTVQNLGSFQLVSKTSSVRRIKYPWNMLSLVGLSLIEAWLDRAWLKLDWIEQTSSNPRNALYQSSLDASLERIWQITMRHSQSSPSWRESDSIFKWYTYDNPPPCNFNFKCHTYDNSCLLLVTLISNDTLLKDKKSPAPLARLSWGPLHLEPTKAFQTLAQESSSLF